MIKEKSFDIYKKDADYIKSIIKEDVEIAIILGSGLSSVMDFMEDKIEIDYKDIPKFPHTTVKIHKGKLIFGKVNDKNIICMSGRFHYYEGYEFSELAHPVYVLKLLGIKTLILTNASGGINYNINPGDIVAITDHINLCGASPTRGNNLEEFGNRFYSLNNIYDKDLREIAKSCAIKLGFSLKEGVYFYAVGPFFETKAEIRAMRILGADIVGMSTITESITAAHCGIKVLGLSLCTNYSSDRVIEHDMNDIDIISKKVEGDFTNLVYEIISRI